MLKSPEFKELLSIFNENKVRYLVVGGYAVMRYAEPRFTKDLDLWIATDRENARRVWKALKEFGAPLENVVLDDFTDESIYYQMGVPPYRVDIMMSLPGVEFESAWKRRGEIRIEEIIAPIISAEDLLQNKKASGRLQDQLDVENLERAMNRDSE